MPVEPHRRRPPDDTLAWVVANVEGGAEVVGWRRLTGGAAHHAAIHRVAVRRRDGDVTQVVLRRWMPGRPDWADWCTTAVRTEMRVLETLEAHGMPAPRAIASTDGAGAGGTPAVLMSKAPGRMNLTPSDHHRWLRDMATTLVRIHAVPADLPPWQRWSDPESMEVPEWTRRPEVWRDARELALTLDEDARRTFIHRDYQHFNLLWRGDRLTAVVDWVNGSLGPPGIDVGHCRLNLAVLFSPAWAEELREVYEAESGSPVDPAADVTSILSYSKYWHDFIPRQVGGRTVVEHPGMNQRIDDLLALAVGRATR